MKLENNKFVLFYAPEFVVIVTAGIEKGFTEEFGFYLIGMENSEKVTEKKVVIK